MKFASSPGGWLVFVWGVGLCTRFLVGRFTHVVSYAAPCGDLLASDYLKNDGSKGEYVSTDAAGSTLVAYGFEARV